MLVLDALQHASLHGNPLQFIVDAQDSLTTVPKLQSVSVGLFFMGNYIEEAFHDGGKENCMRMHPLVTT